MNKSDELTARGFAKKLIGFSMASWLSAALSFVVTPLLTRLYLPEDIGHINMFTTYMTFFQTVCVMALDQTFMRFYNEKLEGLTKFNFLRYCLKINMGIAAVSVIIILAAHEYFAVQIAGEKSWLIPICLCIVIVASTFLRMSSISSRMEKNIPLYTLQVVMGTFSEKVIITLIAFAYAQYQTAILSMTVCYACFSVIIFFMKRKVLYPANNIPPETNRTILKFAIPYLPVLLLAWLNNSIPLLVLRKYVDYSSIGIYTNAVTMANILTIVQTGFSAYWEPFIYEHYKDKNNKEKIRKIEKTIIGGLIFAAVCIVLLQDIIYLLVGEKFRASKVFFPFLMLTPICNSIADMEGIGIKLSNKNYLNIFAFIGNTFVNLLFSYLLVPRIGVMGAGIAVGISAIVMVIIRSFLGRKYYKINDKNKFIFWALIIMGMTCIANAIIESSERKFIVIFILLLILCLIFKKEIYYIRNIFIRELKRRH